MVTQACHWLSTACPWTRTAPCQGSWAHFVHQGQQHTAFPTRFPQHVQCNSGQNLHTLNVTKNEHRVLSWMVTTGGKYFHLQHFAQTKSNCKSHFQKCKWNKTWLSVCEWGSLCLFFSWRFLPCCRLGFGVSCWLGFFFFNFLFFLYIGFSVPLLPIFAIVCTIDKNIHLAGSILIHFIVEDIQEEKTYQMNQKSSVLKVNTRASTGKNPQYQYKWSCDSISHGVESACILIQNYTKSSRDIGTTNSKTFTIT